MYYKRICTKGMQILFLFYQNSSNCCGSSCFLMCWHPRNNSIWLNCLSVIVRIPTYPSLGNHFFTLFIWTSAFSRLGQWRRYIENWNMVNPSRKSCFLKSAYILRSRFVSVGKSKKTKIHIIWYSLNRSIITSLDMLFCESLHCNI